jgi:DNA-binding protein H-NS
MKFDIETLGPRELDLLIVAAEKRKALLATRRPIAAVRNDLSAFAMSHGYSIEELFDIQPPATVAAKPARKRKPGKVAVKYRDPDNRRNTWSGRGRMPRWLADKTRRGKRAADFLVPGLARPTANKRSIGQRTVFKPG